MDPGPGLEPMPLFLGLNRFPGTNKWPFTCTMDFRSQLYLKKV